MIIFYEQKKLLVIKIIPNIQTDSGGGVELPPRKAKVELSHSKDFVLRFINFIEQFQNTFLRKTELVFIKNHPIEHQGYLSANATNLCFSSIKLKPSELLAK